MSYEKNQKIYHMVMSLGLFYFIGLLLPKNLQISQETIYWLSSTVIQSFSSIAAISVMVYTFMRSYFDNDLTQTQRELAQLLAYSDIVPDVEIIQTNNNNVSGFSYSGRSEIISTFPRDDFFGLLDKALTQSDNIHISIKGYMKLYSRRYFSILEQKENFRRYLPVVFFENVIVIVFGLIFLAGNTIPSFALFDNNNVASILIGLGIFALCDNLAFCYKIIVRSDHEKFIDLKKLDKHKMSIKKFVIKCPICNEILEDYQPGDYVNSCPKCKFGMSNLNSKIKNAYNSDKKQEEAEF